MSAHTHTRSTHPAAGGVDFRLPWWGIALPAVAFVVLLLLIVGSGDAQAATGDPTLAHIIERIQQTLSR